METNSKAMDALRARALEIVSKTPTTKKTPKQCACGCGGWTKGGTWIPGHDSKMLSRMLESMRAEAAQATGTGGN